MKKLWGLLTCLCLAACSDIEDLETLVPTSSASRTSASAERDVTSYFDWEASPYIQLLDVPGDVILPWYSGAKGAIPAFITNHYKASEGWELVYNFCTPTEQGKIEKDKHFLFFYNIFSGRLCVYVYNVNNVISSNHTFWRLYFNTPSALLNDFDDLVLSLDKKTSSYQKLVSTCTTSDVKSISLGWNCAEFDLLTYDPTLASQKLNMGLDFYDLENDSIDLNGNLTLRSEGTILTKTPTTNIPGWATTLQQGITAMGDMAAQALEDKKNGTDKKEKSSMLKQQNRISWASVIDLVAKGANKLVAKFTGRKENVPIATSDVKISTDGIAKFQGSFTATKHTNIPSLMHLMVPGTTPTPEDICLPSYNKPLGVWNIKTTPVLRVSNQGMKDFRILERKRETTGEMMYYGFEYITNYIGVDDDAIEIVMNPDILNKIERYDKEVKVIVNEEKNFPEDHLYGFTYYQGNQIGEHYVESGGFDSYAALRALTVYSSDKWITDKELRELKLGQGKYNWPVVANFNRDFCIKVTVTLYPKAPYDTTPIVTTRTFKCDKNLTPIDFN